MHPLKQYLHDVDENIQDFAARVGASRQTLYRIINGVQTPRPALARRIVEATGRAVSLDMLYHDRKNGHASGMAEVISFHGPCDAPPLDHDRLKVAVAVVVNHLTPQNAAPPPDEMADVAAEAIINTYTALSAITTRQGPDRLRQALRPVLEEILQECGASLPASVLDRGSDLATQLYFQTGALARRS